MCVHTYVKRDDSVAVKSPLPVRSMGLRRKIVEEIFSVLDKPLHRLSHDPSFPFPVLVEQHGLSFLQEFLSTLVSSSRTLGRTSPRVTDLYLGKLVVLFFTVDTHSYGIRYGYISLFDRLLFPLEKEYMTSLPSQYF